MFQCGKAKEALELAACINERRDLAAENVKKIKVTGVEVEFGFFVILPPSPPSPLLLSIT